MGGVLWLTPLRGQINRRHTQSNSIVPLMKLPALMPPDKNLRPKNTGLMLSLSRLRCDGMRGGGCKKAALRCADKWQPRDWQIAIRPSCNYQSSRSLFRSARHRITQRAQNKLGGSKPCRPGEKGNACKAPRQWQIALLLDDSTHFCLQFIRNENRPKAIYLWCLTFFTQTITTTALTFFISSYYI